MRAVAPATPPAPAPPPSAPPPAAAPWTPPPGAARPAGRPRRPPSRSRRTPPAGTASPRVPSEDLDRSNAIVLVVVSAIVALGLVIIAVLASNGVGPSLDELEGAAGARSAPPAATAPGHDLERPVAGEFDDIRNRLDVIAEELADLAIARLRESIDAGGTELPVDEKRLTRAPPRRREGGQHPARARRLARLTDRRA